MEYKIFYFSSVDTSTWELEKLYREGWEPVMCCSYGPYGALFTLKRKK